MRILPMGAGLLCLALGCLAAVPGADAQTVKPAVRDQEQAVHRMEIYNGPFRTVHYFSYGLSRGEQNVLQDLERAENNLSLSNQVASLRTQYVADERFLESQRIAAAGVFGGTYLAGGIGSTAYPITTYDTVGSSGYPFSAGFYGPHSSQTLVFAPNGMLVSGSTSVGYGPGYGGYPAPALPAYAPAPVTTAEWAPGGGDVLRSDLARTVAAMGTPEAVDRARRDLDTALVRASESDKLRSGLDLNKKDALLAGYETSGKPHFRVTVTMKAGGKIDGTLLREDKDSLVVGTDDGETEIRKNETATIAKTRLSDSGK